MKKLSVLFFILFVLSLSQCFPRNMGDSIPDDDILLIKVKNLLPAGWSLIKNNDALIIQRDELVYVLFENMINAPVSLESREETEKRIKEKGELKRAMYILSFYPKLSVLEINNIKSHNDSIRNIINLLPDKFEIKDLLDKFASSKGEEVYVGKTDEEKKRIEKYKILKNKLNEELVRLPDFNSEKYSLYIDMIIGRGDEFHLVHPYEASTEMYKIIEILNENLIKIK